MRVALGIAYRGSAYSGWQSQPGGRTVQDQRRAPRSAPFADRADRDRSAPGAPTPACTRSTRSSTSTPTSSAPPTPGCAAPTATCRPTSPCSGAASCPTTFHSRASARGRRYAYLLLESPVRPALESRPRRLDLPPPRRRRDAARPRALLSAAHDFSAFRSAECQAPSPVKTLRALAIERRGAYWRFDFDADAFLHHMIRNIIGCLVAVGSGARAPALARRGAGGARPLARRARPSPPDGLYFVGPYYDAVHAHPRANRGDGLAALSAAARRARAPMNQRTRIKICGVSRREPTSPPRSTPAPTRSASSSIRGSPRFVDAGAARAQLARALPPFVTPVGLFVNAAPADVDAVARARSRRSCCSSTATRRPTQCAAVGRPYLRAARMAPGFDLLDFARRFSEAPRPPARRPCRGLRRRRKGIRLVARSRRRSRHRLVLSGGLHAGNVGAGIRQLRPWAVDVSSGVESSRGVKDAAAIRRFCDAVREADARIAASTA